MTVIFLDECGYTGEDLLNKDQPFFALASLSLPEEDCVNLKNHFFGKVNSREIKHSSLAKSRAQQQLVVNFLSELKSQQQYFKVAVAHKQYALVGKLVDLIIETALHEQGYDLYNQGANIATTNLFYNTMPAFGGEAFFDELLARFQDMARLKTFDSYKRFLSFVRQKQKSKHLEQELNMIRAALKQLGQRLILTWPENSLDIAFTHAMVMMAAWRQELSGQISLIHDASTNMSKQKFIWEALMSPDLAPAEVGYDRRKWTFPIGVSKTTFEKSENWAGLQLTDVLAGAFCRAAKWAYVSQDATDTYGRDLVRVVEDIVIIPLLPGTEVTPEELGTVGNNAGDPNEYLAKIIRDAKRE
jgi:hypothetical protein